MITMAYAAQRAQRQVDLDHISDLPQSAIAKELEALTSKLSERSREFALSLLSQYGKRGLTSKQDYWMRKLYRQAVEGEKPLAQVSVGDLTGVENLLNTAKSNGLKYPRITMETSEGNPVQISMAGSRSKAPGSLNITDGGRYGSNTWYGRVIDGRMTISPRALEAHPDETKDVCLLLSRLASTPKETITEYGRMSGYCACCGRKLTDPASMKLGMGPVCASRFGLV
jgi:hypothetical protein